MNLHLDLNPWENPPPSHSLDKVFSNRVDYAEDVLIRPVSKILDWNLFARGASSSLQNSKKFYSRTYHCINWINLPHRVYKLFHLTGSTWIQAIKGTKIVTGMLALFAGALRIAHEEYWISLSIVHLRVIDYVGLIASVATLINTFFEINQEMTQISHQTVGTPQFNVSIFKLITRICRVAAGLFGIYVFTFGGGAIAKIAMLSISSISILTSNLKYNYINKKPFNLELNMV